MITLSMDPGKQVCKSIGVVDLDEVPEAKVGERVLLDFPDVTGNIPGAFVRIDREKNLGFIQVLDMYRLFA